MVITSISLTGSFLKLPSQTLSHFPPNSEILLRFALPGIAPCEHRGVVVRRENAGCAIKFAHMEQMARRNLWKFICDNIGNPDFCPYCGAKPADSRGVCTSCEWRLDFDSGDYFSYHEKNCTIKSLVEKMRALDIEMLKRLAGQLEGEVGPHQPIDEDQQFVGTSQSMLDVFSKIRKVATTNLSVLILGESGTGKELTAMAIHERSERREKPFVAINSAAIPEALLEAELFGYDRGAFTGAYTNKKGKFEHADGGTVFLDEIGDMPLNLQTKLLRFLQDKTVERVGAVKGKKVDIRLIAATNQDLAALVGAGKFRGDLYHRLDEFTIWLPPVRERGEDKIILARFFLKKFAREMGGNKVFSVDATEAILNYSWPGNVRELINKVRRAVVMSAGDSLTPADLGLDTVKLIDDSAKSLIDEISMLELQKIREVLLATNNNISKAAKLLGLSRPTLYSRIKKYSKHIAAFPATL